MDRIKISFFLTWFLFLFSRALATSDYSIVFTYTGEELPSYLKTSISQARLFNKECPIFLVARKNAAKSWASVLRKNTVKLVQCESLKKSVTHQFFLKQTSVKKGTERFFYLEELMSHYNLKNVFHLEADVMLYVDLKKLFPFFKARYPGIAAAFDNDERCIPSFMFISNSKVLHKMAVFMGTKAAEENDETHLIAQFKDAANEMEIDYLPVIMDSYIVDHTLQSHAGHIARNPGRFCNNFTLFQSVFDAAALGQFLGGDIKKQQPPGFINESCVFDPSCFIYEWRKDSEGRPVPYMIYGNKKYRINNLHIRSKELYRFTS